MFQHKYTDPIRQQHTCPSDPAEEPADPVSEMDYQFTDTELRLGVEMYLTNLPYSMWSDWEIKHPDRRRLAAEWLYDQIRSVIGVIEEASKAKRG